MSVRMRALQKPFGMFLFLATSLKKKRSKKRTSSFLGCCHCNARKLMKGVKRIVNIDKNNLSLLTLVCKMAAVGDYESMQKNANNSRVTR